jgi:DNA-binding transcriptional regulator GbsR (MarR family)
MELKPLTREEVKSLLLYWGDKLEINDLKEFVENKPGQLETIRILTDGLPRTLQFFVNILLTHSQETGYDYLRLLMDKVTPLYQERLNYLPPSQRKIVLQLAFFWEAVGAKELAQVTRMETRLISAQLNQLIEKGVVTKVETKTKNHLYRLSERFFNLWLIFTQGSQTEKRKARYLSIFLENFYDKREIIEMAEKHLDAVQEQKISANKAVLLTKAYSKMPDSAFNLSLFYYTHNKNKSEVSSILKSLPFEKLDEVVLPQLQVIKVWIGDLKNLEQGVRKLVDENKYDLTFMLTELLVHHQVNLVYRLFTSGENASQLVEKYLPIYYATQLLMPDAQQAAIKIPPELKETVNELLSDIHENRDFYYNRK